MNCETRQNNLEANFTRNLNDILNIGNSNTAQGQVKWGKGQREQVVAAYVQLLHEFINFFAGKSCRELSLSPCSFRMLVALMYDVRWKSKRSGAPLSLLLPLKKQTVNKFCCFMSWLKTSLLQSLLSIWRFCAHLSPCSLRTLLHCVQVATSNLFVPYKNGLQLVYSLFKTLCSTG